MNPRILAIVLLSAFVAPLFFIAPTTAVPPTEWFEEIPGVASAVNRAVISGDDEKQGIAYRIGTGVVGFTLRENGVWSHPTTDISGASANIVEPDLCYQGGDTWVLLGRVSPDTTVWQTINDGANWTIRGQWSNTASIHGLDCNGSRIGVAWKTTGSAGVADVNATVGTGTPPVFAPEKTVISGSTATIRSVDAAVSSNRVYVAATDEVGTNHKWLQSNTDDNGLFWSTEVDELSGQSTDNCITFNCRLGMGASGTDWFIVGHITDNAVPEPAIGLIRNGGVLENYDPPTSDLLCGSVRCNIGLDELGRVLMPLWKSGSSTRLILDEGNGFTLLTGHGLPQVDDASALLENLFGMIAYADTNQGGRLEVRYAAFPPPAAQYTNPNGQNWGEIKASYDASNPEVYLKERIASDDEALGHVYRTTENLALLSHFNACPSTTYSGGVGGTTKSESLSTPGNLAIYPDPASPTIVSTACLNDYTTTDEHYVINTFTGSGAFTGGMPYADVDFIDNPAHIDVCLNGGVGIQSFAQVDYINFTVANVFGAQTEYLTFDVSRGHEKSFTVPDLAITTVDPLSRETCSLYYVSTTDGFGKVSHIRGGATVSVWANAASGNGIAAYGGRVWVANTGGTLITEYADLGNSFSTIGTKAVTTVINPFNERLSVSHDGAYLIAHCATDAVCVIDSTTGTVIVNQPVPSGGVIHYDLDHYNRYLYVARDTVAYAYPISEFTSAFGDPENCVGPTPPAACTPTTTTTSTTTGIGPGGVGGSQGGFIDEPGSGIPGLDIEGTASSIGMSTAALAWLLGILWISIFTVAFGTLPMLGSGGKFSVGLAAIGYIVGLGGATAFSLIPVWFILVNGVLGAGFLVMKLRSA